MEQSQQLQSQFIETVRTASDYEAVAAGYDRIVRLGTRAITPCPCHQEPTLSLFIDQESQIGRCWMCLAAGDVFWMVMKREDICFRDAVRLLANRAGIVEPVDITWTTSQLQRLRATTEPGARPSVLSLRSLQAPRRLRI